MKKAKRKTPTDGAKELLDELVLLRARVDDATEQFNLGVKARIDEIHRTIAGGDSPDAGHVVPEPRLVEKMVRRLRLLTRRQPKGKAKDLKRIQDLVTSLNEAVLSRE